MVKKKVTSKKIIKYRTIEKVIKQKDKIALDKDSKKFFAVKTEEFIKKIAAKCVEQCKSLNQKKITADILLNVLKKYMNYK